MSTHASKSACRVAAALSIIFACAEDPVSPHQPAGDRPPAGDTLAGDQSVGDPSPGDSSPGDTGGGDATGPGPLCLFPSSLIFPPPAIGVPASTSAFSFGTVSITNCSAANVEVRAPALGLGTDPEISIDFAPFSGTATLIPWETVLVELLFAPERVATDFTGTLEVGYGPGSDVAIAGLSGSSVTDPGTCLLQLGPTLVSAGDPLASVMQVEPTAAGSAVNDTFMLVNIGRTPCTVTSVDLTGDAVFSFPYPTQITTPITLAFRQLKLINLRFEPSVAGSYATTVTFVGDDGSHTMAVSALAY